MQMSCVCLLQGRTILGIPQRMHVLSTVASANVRSLSSDANRSLRYYGDVPYSTALSASLPKPK